MNRQPFAVSVSVIVPAMNEADNLPHVFATLPDLDRRGHPRRRQLERRHRRGGARRLRPDLRVVTQTGRGKGNALIEGFAAATRRHHRHDRRRRIRPTARDPRLRRRPRRRRRLRQGLPLRAGRGLRRHQPAALASATGSSTGLTNLLFGTRYTDLCYGYNAFWARHLHALDLDCDGFEIETLMNVRAAQAGPTIHEVPSHERCRIHGESNLHAVRDGLRVLRTILRERFRQVDASRTQVALVKGEVTFSDHALHRDRSRSGRRHHRRPVATRAGTRCCWSPAAPTTRRSGVTACA